MEGKFTGKLIKKIFLNGKIITVTGLHIGGTSSGFEIGGTDNIVIRDPITNCPYIPGSSIKGKMRALLEKLRGEFSVDLENKKAGPSAERESLSGKLFGTSSEKEKFPSRVIVRDAFMDKETRETLESLDTDLPYTEVKTEVAIDRITSEANPRQMERVPAGSSFDFEIILNIFEGDPEKELIDGLFQAMMLLQDDYLGGSGSRGYGKIKFSIRSITYKTQEEYENKEEAKVYQIEIPEELK